MGEVKQLYLHFVIHLKAQLNNHNEQPMNYTYFQLY